MTELSDFARTDAARRIRSAASRLSHAIILSGPGERAAAARYAAAAYECVSEGERPCLRCAHCRKVMEGIHPDVSFARDEAHRELSADTIRALRSDAFIRPNEGARKVYIFEDCALLNEKGQNILLKLVEEGPPYAAFLFCAENSAALLPTIRSRCVELKLGGGEETAAGGSERARALCRLSAEGGGFDRAAYLVKLEQGKLSRQELGALFEEARLLLAEALLIRSGKPAPPEEAAFYDLLNRRLSAAKTLRLIELLDKYRLCCDYNVGAGVTLGGFAAEWAEALR